MPYSRLWTPNVARPTPQSTILVRTWDGKPVPGATFTMSSRQINVTVPEKGRYSLFIRTGSQSETATLAFPESLDTPLPIPARLEEYIKNKMGLSPSQQGFYEHSMRVSEMRERVGKVEVKNAAVTIVMDHGLNAFNSIVYPLLQARGIPVTLALNSDWQNPKDARYATNNEVTPAMVKSWVDAGLVEPANHGRTHTAYEDNTENTREVQQGREELEAMLSTPIDSWVQVGSGSGNGFDSGNDPKKYWTTHLGQEIVRNHAVVTGLVPGDRLYSLDGQPTIGMQGGWIDSGAATANSAIDSAISSGQGHIVRFHPQVINQTNRITTADLTAFLDRLVALRNAGRIDILTLRQFAVAQRASVQDTGWRKMPTLTGAAVDATRPGSWYLRRVGNKVYARLVGVGLKGTVIDFIGPNAIPAGFITENLSARMFETASQHSTGVVAVYGPSHKVLVADNDIVWRGMLNPTTGAFSTTAPADSTGIIHGEMSWTTSAPFPTTLPGTPA